MILRLHNSLSGKVEPFVPRERGYASIYSCGPTVYNYAHLGNLRAYVFADTLSRALSMAGHEVRHIINITDVGHLVGDGDAGEDKALKAALEQNKSVWTLTEFYTEAFKQDLQALHVRDPKKFTKATDYVDLMKLLITEIARKGHTYELDSGLYFDTSTIDDYGVLTGGRVESEVQSRIGDVAGKRNPEDFALWRKYDADGRNMCWESPWGQGAPGWHIECSAMSRDQVGVEFDIHTGGIDHKQVHHANEIAQNKALCGHEGARFWMHNNFLVDKGGRIAKSRGDFLRLDTIVGEGFHPLAYRMMLLQAHYRSELLFDWDLLRAASTRLERMVRAMPEAAGGEVNDEYWKRFETYMADDLNTPKALSLLDEVLRGNTLSDADKRTTAIAMDEWFGFGLHGLTLEDFRIRPIRYTIEEAEVEMLVNERLIAKREKDFQHSDQLRKELGERGVQVMDGDDKVSWWWKV